MTWRDKINSDADTEHAVLFMISYNQSHCNTIYPWSCWKQAIPSFFWPKEPLKVSKESFSQPQILFEGFLRISAIRFLLMTTQEGHKANQKESGCYIIVYSTALMSESKTSRPHVIYVTLKFFHCQALKAANLACDRPLLIRLAHLFNPC